MNTALQSLNETKEIMKQLTAIGRIMDIDPDYEPHKAQKNLYRFEYFLKVPDSYLEKINADILKKLFNTDDVSVIDTNYFTITTSNKAEPELLKQLLDSLEPIRKEERKKAIPNLEVKTNEEEQGKRIIKSKDLDKKDEKNTKDTTVVQETAKKNPLPSLTWLSKATFNPNDEKCEVKLVQIPERCSRPQNSLFTIWKLSPEYFNDPIAEQAFKASAQKLAEARQNRQGLILLNGEKMKTENMGEVEGQAKVKRKETFGDISVISSKKETVLHEGKTKTLYHLDAVKHGTHIKF